MWVCVDFVLLLAALVVGTLVYWWYITRRERRKVVHVRRNADVCLFRMFHLSIPPPSQMANLYILLRPFLRKPLLHLGGLCSADSVVQILKYQ